MPKEKRNEKKKRKAKRKEKEEKGRETKEKENSLWERKGKGKEREKAKGRISRRSDGRSSPVRVLKLVHAAQSTRAYQKVGVSINSIR